jgi:hypothetical protein
MNESVVILYIEYLMHNELTIIHDGDSKNMKKENRNANFYEIIIEI